MKQMTDYDGVSCSNRLLSRACSYSKSVRKSTCCWSSRLSTPTYLPDQGAHGYLRCRALRWYQKRTPPLLMGSGYGAASERNRERARERYTLGSKSLKRTTTCPRPPLPNNLISPIVALLRTSTGIQSFLLLRERTICIHPSLLTGQNAVYPSDVELCVRTKKGLDTSTWRPAVYTDRCPATRRGCGRQTKH
jgi:hypothetical protein